MGDTNINLEISIGPDDYHNLETILFCKPWHFPIFALLYTGTNILSQVARHASV